MEVYCHIESLYYSLIEDQVYVIGEIAMLIEFEEYQSNPNCGAEVEYEAELSNGQSLPPFINLNKKSRTFMIYAESAAYRGKYEIRIMAKVENKDTTIVRNKANIMVLEMVYSG